MIIKADIDRQQKIKNFARQSQINDSLEIERQYLSLINSGNLYFSKRQYIMARKIFEKAQQINPKRKYPAYKLEDINTELEIFKKKLTR
jgi:tetratricopeptide (TPR) repeat protein